MRLQISMSEVPAQIFLDGDSKKIMFYKVGNHGNFIDYQRNGGSYAAWTKTSLCIEDKEYRYGEWHNIKKEDDPLINEYFKSVLTEQ